MSEYRGPYCKGGWYFFTVVTYDRKKILTQPANIIRFRNALQIVKDKYPFYENGIVILPDHIQCIWQLPTEDDNFSMRWKLIKQYFSISVNTPLSGRARKTVWQSRFCEHLLKDEKDFRAHLDYIHYNPVKHGYVKNPRDWHYSSFNNAVKHGLYDENWGASEPCSIREMNLE